MKTQFEQEKARLNQEALHLAIDGILIVFPFSYMRREDQGHETYKSSGEKHSKTHKVNTKRREAKQAREERLKADK